MPGIVSVGILVALLFTLPSFAADANKDLCKAASEWDVATVRALLAEGTDVNGKCPDGTTPLLKAAAGGITGVVEALLAQGADVKARDSDNRLSLLIGVVKDQVRFVREEDEVGPLGPQHRQVGFQRSWILCQVGRLVKLRGVDEDADQRSIVLCPGASHEREVPLVQRAHGGNKTERQPAPDLGQTLAAPGRRHLDDGRHG